MKSDYLRKFVSLRSALQQEKAQLEARLREINRAMSESPGAAREMTSVTQAKPTRKISAAGRARIAAAQKARWAKLKAGVKAPVSKPKVRRKLSAEGRARIAAAAKARWAKVRAEKGQ